MSATGMQEDDTDRLLLQSGVARSADAIVTLNPEGLRLLLDQSRQSAISEAGPVRSLPKNAEKRMLMLERLGREVFDRPDLQLTEKALGDRLASRVEDVALFRRALVDYFVVTRDAAGTSYTLALDGKEIK